MATQQISKIFGILFALIIAGLLQSIVTLEWSYPYCNNPQDGTAYPVYGFPFPYAMADQASSLNHLFMPHIFLLNLIVIAATFYPFVIQLLRGYSVTAKPRLLTAVGIILFSVFICLRGFLFAFGQPVITIADSYLSLKSLRPVAIQLLDTPRRQQCQASGFWFSR